MKKSEMNQGAERELNLSDFALFLTVMKNREAHESVLSIIMNEKDLKLTATHVEEVILNRVGQRAIRLDALATDEKDRRFATEMQNDTDHDDMRKRSRYYQSLLDTPVLKSGREKRYRDLPATVVTFITQKDIFGKGVARYTFTEQCEEISGLKLEDGTTKIFLNMESLNGDPVLVSLLQYMKKTQIDNPDILVQDERILKLDHVVQEVRQSEEWEAVSMSIYKDGLQEGMQKGIQQGIQQGMEQGLIQGKIHACRQLGQTKDQTIALLSEDGTLSKEEAKRYLEQFWEENKQDR